MTKSLSKFVSLEVYIERLVNNEHRKLVITGDLISAGKYLVFGSVKQKSQNVCSNFCSASLHYLLRAYFRVEQSEQAAVELRRQSTTRGAYFYLLSNDRLGKCATIELTRAFINAFNAADVSRLAKLSHLSRSERTGFCATVVHWRLQRYIALYEHHNTARLSRAAKSVSEQCATANAPIYLLRDVTFS